MSWLDSVIFFLSPIRGAKREAWRRYGEEIRHYDAGDYGRLNSDGTLQIHQEK